ncbi:MAG: MFS transporter, partial [Proteobacteria bacterium]|nr:MFS transporter [Burkholderiales bacterium]
AGAIAGALGPLLGGWLVDTAGWRTIFLLNLPIAAAAGVLAWRYVCESHDRRGARSIDWAGAALITIALALLTWALTVAAAAGSVSALPALSALAGVAFAGLFVWLQARLGDRALMPLALFGTTTFVGLTLFTLFLYLTLGGLVVALPFLLIRIEGWSAAAAGAALLPVPIVIAAASRLMGRITARHGGGVPLAIGAAMVGVGLALYARLEAGTVDYWIDILPATLMVALGMGISVAPLTTLVIGAVDTDHVGVASGFNSAVARIAGLLATAMLGSVFTLQDSADIFVAGLHVAAFVGAASAAIAGACALVLVRARAGA